jgi:hypothetical protein
LGELVKCKTSKSILPPKTHVRPDISGLIAGFQKLSALSDLVAEFQRHFSDMSGLQTGHV